MAKKLEIDIEKENNPKILKRFILRLKAMIGSLQKEISELQKENEELKKNLT